MRFMTVDIEMCPASHNIIQIGAHIWDTQMQGCVEEFNVYLAREDVQWSYVLSNGKTLREYLPYGPETLLKGISPAEGLSRFQEMLTRGGFGRKVLTWSGGDMPIITSQSRDLSSYSPHRLDIIDLKQIYKVLIRPGLGLPDKSGLSAAYAALELDKIYGLPTYHDAAEDSLATGRIALYLYRMLNFLKQIRRGV